MNGFRPMITRRHDLLTVSLNAGSGERQLRFDGVVDRTSLGEIIGIEILDLYAQLAGAGAPTPPTEGLPRWSYDNEIDAFYVRVGEGAAQVQTSTSGIAYVNADGELAVLEIPLTHLDSPLAGD